MKAILYISALIFLLSFVGFSQKTLPKNYDRSVKIIYKPKPAGPDQTYGSVCIRGSVILRIEFLDSGEIGKIFPIMSLPYGLTENSIEVAKQIRFKPAKKDGKAITVFRQVEYSFGLY